ncbi:MAG: CCA tRNA nucleotidyltransferase [Alistipes sp.]|nr:CCA tRNA nucleotidyltransferase [Alistipes sp.]
MADPLFRRIGRIAAEGGQRAYVIGGYVRDWYLGRPCTDIDVVVTGCGIDVARRLGRELGTNVAVFRNFGTAMLRAGGYEVEFVGARKESYRADSRKPVVEDGTLEDDQLRRDFTINALAWSLGEEDFALLVDPFGGMEDLSRCIIRTPCNADRTFSDDPLRMMRAVRFAAQLGFDIDPATFDAIARNRGRIEIVSRERITTELNKIILSPVPSIGFELLDKTGLLPLIFPELAELKGVERVGGHAHKDNFIHTLKVLDNVALRSDDLWLRWAALLHDIAKPRTKAYDARTGWTFHGHEVVGSKMVPAIFRRMRLPLGDRMKFVQKLVFLHLRPIVLSEDEVTDSAVRRLLFEAGDDTDALMTLCEADITSGIESKVRRYLKNFALVRRKMAEIEEKDRVRNFQPPISGELIMETYGIGPSREVGIIKSEIKEAILDGCIANDYHEAYALMRQVAAGLGLKEK